MLTPEPEIASQLLANCLLERIRSRDDCWGSAVCLFDRSLMRTPPTSSSACDGCTRSRQMIARIYPQSSHLAAVLAKT